MAASQFIEGVITCLVLLDGHKSPFMVSILSPLSHWQSPSCVAACTDLKRLTAKAKAIMGFAKHLNSSFL